MQAFQRWATEHEALWQLIKFNVLSNISTIIRFAGAWAGTAILIGSMGLTEPFHFLIFDYTAAGSGGLGGFLTFLIAEILAQTVNFFVQMKLVFKSDANFKTAAAKFAVLAALIVVVSLVLPGHVTTLCLSWGIGAELAATVASVVNTLLAVVVSFPVLKFWITPSNQDAASKQEAPELA